MENSLKMTALSPENVVQLLKRAGCRDMTMEILERDIAAGLPVNGDGTINLIEYTAWMIREVNRDGNESEQTQTD